MVPREYIILPTYSSPYYSSYQREERTVGAEFLNFFLGILELKDRAKGRSPLQDTMSRLVTLSSLYTYGGKEDRRRVDIILLHRHLPWYLCFRCTTSIVVSFCLRLKNLGLPELTGMFDV